MDEADEDFEMLDDLLPPAAGEEPASFPAASNDHILDIIQTGNTSAIAEPSPSKIVEHTSKVPNIRVNEANEHTAEVEAKCSNSEIDKQTTNGKMTDV